MLSNIKMHYKILFIFFFIILFVPSSSYSQLEEYNFETAIDIDKIYIFVQIQIRDPSSNLVGYIETDRIVIVDIETFTEVLDEAPDDPAKKRKLFIDGQEYEVITGIGETRPKSDTVVSLSTISNNGRVIAYANHDGYPVRDGDEAISTWTIIRPAA